MNELAKLTMTDPAEFGPRIVEQCGEAGVLAAFVAELKGTHISGATRWLDTNKALLVLSLRHKTDDHFWFSFFHEAAHIILHGKREFFLDEANGELDKQEEEANHFAKNMLIPQKAWQKFIANDKFTKSAIRRFARQINIAPGVVVGRLQKEGLIDWSWHNDLKRKLEIKEG